MPQFSFNSPLGSLTLSEEDDQIVSLDWGWASQNWETALLCEAKIQLDAYFDGKLTTFDLPLSPPGTDFQQQVWQKLLTIPWGKTQSYGALATDIKTSPRAIGAACGRNPIPILIPCHRVLGTHKKLGGYSGIEGTATKAFLLRLEGVTDFILPPPPAPENDRNDF